MFLEIVAVLGVILANVICYACHDKSLIRYKFGGPKVLFISNRSSSSLTKLPGDYWALQVLDPEHLVTSYFLNEVCVLLLRVFHLAFFVVTLLLEGITGDGYGNPGNWFTFFTNWTFLLFGIWALWGVALTASHIQGKIRPQSSRKPRQEPEESLRLNVTGTDSGTLHGAVQRQEWGFWSIGYLFTTEITSTSTLFLSFFYWTFLFSPKAPIEVDNLLKHGANNLVLLLEVFLCRTPIVSYHYQAVLLYGTIYTIFMWIYHAASLRWVYWVLDWTKGTAIGLYLLNPIFLFLAFLFWFCIACAREWLGKLVCRQQSALVSQAEAFDAD